jgi:23S rRNA (uracil1939-C5)-methyltransferase
MTKKTLPIVSVNLDKMVGGGQTIATLESGLKLFVWGGLPDEIVEVQLTKKKSKLAEGIVVNVINASSNRVVPRDVESYLSTSPWQIMNFKSEQHYKSALIEEAFELHNIILPEPIEIYSDNNKYEYRNKIEFSWWWDKDKNVLDLAFFRRGTHGKIPVSGTSLANPAINHAAIALRDLLRKKTNVRAFMLKTVLIRCSANGNVGIQLYVKEPDFEKFTNLELELLRKKVNVIGFELIFSNPKSPASVITERLQSWGETSLTDMILDVPFTYTIEGFFQINLPIYQHALLDIKKWVDTNLPTVDMYSGVGTIGLTVGGKNVTMVEISEQAVNEMKRNITALDCKKTVTAILAPSENALEYIKKKSNLIVDPPRAGLHEKVTFKILETLPERIIYLSCNPVTQARDIARLSEKYVISYHRGYNFFPRTPHIEHLVVLDIKNNYFN